MTDVLSTGKSRLDSFGSGKKYPVNGMNTSGKKLKVFRLPNVQ